MNCLVKDRDYTLAFPTAEYISAGTKQIVINGIGNYCGSKTVSYQIIGGPAPSETPMVSITPTALPRLSMSRPSLGRKSARQSAYASNTSVIQAIGGTNCTSIGSYAFRNCSKLTTASFPACTSIGGWAFAWCYILVSLYLPGSSVCSLAASNAFSSTPIGGCGAKAGRFGSIYVPQSLLTTYQTATNWTYFSSRFVGT